MLETHLNSQESFTRKGVKKVALSAAKVAAAGALLVSPEASASEMMEQQKAPVTYEEKIEAATGHHMAVINEEHALKLDSESASLRSVVKEDLSQPVYEQLEWFGRNTNDEREYYELTTRTQEPDEIAAERGIFEEGRVSERDYLSMTTVIAGSFEGWALDENGAIVGSIEVLHSRGGSEYNTATGETDISLILGLPEDDSRVITYEIHAEVQNRLIAEAYCEDDGEIVAGISIETGEEPYKGMLEPFVIDADGLKPRS